MKSLIRICLPLLLTLLCATAATAGERGEKALGLRAGYNTRNHSAATGIWFQYSFSRLFRIAPNVDYIFRHNGTDAYGVNINAHFTFPLANPAWQVYPLAGVSWTTWNTRLDDPAAIDDNTVRRSRLGLNVGAGLEWKVTPSLKLNVEAKYNAVKTYSGGAFTAGIGYVF